MIFRQITKPNLGDSDKSTIELKDEIKDAMDLDQDSVLDISFDTEDEVLIIKEVEEKRLFDELEVWTELRSRSGGDS